jgi:hypothetical protein
MVPRKGTEMYIWTIERIGEVREDENEGFVIIAEHSKRARQIAFDASEETGVEGSHMWLSDEFTSIRSIGEAHEILADGTRVSECLIMRDYNRG